MSTIHILHENDEWTAPLRAALERGGHPHRDWFLDAGAFDLSRPPPEGVFYNRMSASSHTRGHRYAPEIAAAVLAWLEQHDRRVINGSGALRLEISKAAQYAALARHGIRTPRTVMASGADHVVEAAQHFDGPFVTKHNRAGRGLGVRRFEAQTELADYVHGPDFEASVDGITLVQEFIDAPDATITRVEMIGRELAYAVRVDTSTGFELCPADACAVGVATSRPRFEIIDGFEHPNVDRYRRLMAAHEIEVAAFEMVFDAEARAYTYDVNTNTNYNREAERRAGVSAMATLAAYLARELQALV